MNGKEGLERIPYLLGIYCNVENKNYIQHHLQYRF